jgi:2-iminobutanoate/2-iminopropanoate deaminase
MRIDRVNPATLHQNAAFAQIVVAEGVSKLITIGGQNAVDVTGAVVGDDLKTQTGHALHNVLDALDEVGATQENVIRLGIYIVQGQDSTQAYAAAQETWGRHSTAITVLIVAALANPEFLVEIEATAVL